MRARAGFTLLEIAIAMAILGVGIVSVLQIFGASLRLQDRATRETAAVREARTAIREGRFEAFRLGTARHLAPGQ